MIFEEDIEKQDFLEIILTQEEYEKLPEEGAVKDFQGIFRDRNLNVYVRIQKCR